MEDMGTERTRNKSIEERQQEIRTLTKPATKRSASGCNWIMYKDKVCKEGSNNDKKNNLTNKSSNKFQNSKKVNYLCLSQKIFLVNLYKVTKFIVILKNNLIFVFVEQYVERG